MRQLHNAIYQPCSNENHQISTQVVDLGEVRNLDWRGN